MVYLPGVIDGHPSTPPPQQGIVSGYVSKSRPAPASFDDPVYVIVPSHGIDTPYGPVSWPAVHGLAMPVPGSPIWLAFDGDGVPVVVWWTATYVAAPPAVIPTGTTGGAGGALEGTFPNPTLRDVRSVLDFGADPSSSRDSTAAFNRALTDGPSFVPPGDYKILGVVTVPTNSTGLTPLVSNGGVILHLGAGGQIRVGNRLGTGGIPMGGQVGPLIIDGGGVANVTGGGLYVGLITQARFPGIIVRNCLGDGLVIESAQNCGFDDLYIGNCGGHGLVFDTGCGSNIFSGHTEITACGGYNVVFRQTVAGPTGVFANGPSYNMIFGGFIENSIFNGVQNLGLVHHSAGVGNTLIIPNGFAATPAAAPYSLVTMDVTGPAAISVDLTFVNCNFQDNSGHSIGLDMKGNTSVTLIGKTGFTNLVTGIQSYDTDNVTVIGQINWATVTTKWQKNAASPPTSFQSVIRAFEHTRKDFVLNAATDDAITAYVSGDAAYRLQLNLGGVWVGDGTFSPTSVVGFQYYTPDGGATKYLYFPSGIEVAGNLVHIGTKSAVNGNVPVVKAAAIASPTSDTVGGKAAIDAIRTALTNFGITL